MVCGNIYRTGAAMTVQITIIGLGQIGTSIGLSLARHIDSIKRVGYDRALDVQNKAKSMGAFDEVKFNLPSAIEEADVVLLCIPMDQVEETLKLIAPDLRKDAVVMDFSPLKSAAHGWFKNLIPAGRYYIGLVPSTNPDVSETSGGGVYEAQANLFDNATIGIAAPPGTAAGALKLANDLVSMIGASSIFLDMLEADGMMMTTHIFPQIMSAALLNATVGQPGWVEARRFAGGAYAQVSGAVGADSIEALTLALLSNPPGALSLFDNAIGALAHMREAVKTGDQADLQRRLALAFDDREKWLVERNRADWDMNPVKSSLPKSGDAIRRFFLGGRTRDKKK
jgi:prephenate dehydrogenase